MLGRKLRSRRVKGLPKRRVEGVVVKSLGSGVRLRGFKV